MMPPILGQARGAYRRLTGSTCRRSSCRGRCSSRGRSRRPASFPAGSADPTCRPPRGRSPTAAAPCRTSASCEACGSSRLLWSTEGEVPNAAGAETRALQVSAQRLVALDRLEERLEVALAERRRAVALDDFEEDGRPVLRRLREDLQQVAVVVAVGQDPQPLEVAVVLGDLAHAPLDLRVVRVGRVEEDNPRLLQRGDAADDVLGLQRDVLHARAVVELEVLLDLALALALGRLVDR